MNRPQAKEFRNVHVSVAVGVACSAESMLVVLFILAILFGVLMILTVAICCYICARRCWIKVRQMAALNSCINCSA